MPRRAALLLALAIAGAVDLAPTSSASAPAPPPAPRQQTRGELASFAVVFDASALLLRRYGVDGMYMFAPKHAVLLNLHYDYASGTYPAFDYDHSDAYYGGGGEIGYRHYPQGHGFAGGFVGPSIIAAWYRVPYYGQYFTLREVGGAFDGGAQFVVGEHFTLLFGVGLQYLLTSQYPKDIAPGIETNVGHGLQARAFFALGAVF
jgi:hypothetical protein